MLAPKAQPLDHSKRSFDPTTMWERGPQSDKCPIDMSYNKILNFDLHSLFFFLQKVLNYKRFFTKKKGYYFLLLSNSEKIKTNYQKDVFYYNDRTTIG